MCAATGKFDSIDQAFESAKSIVGVKRTDDDVATKQLKFIDVRFQNQPETRRIIRAKAAERNGRRVPSQGDQPGETCFCISGRKENARILLTQTHIILTEFGICEPPQISRMIEYNSPVSVLGFDRVDPFGALPTSINVHGRNECLDYCM